MKLLGQEVDSVKKYIILWSSVTMGNCSGRGTMIVYLKHPFYIVYTHLQEQVTDLSENAEL